MLQFIRRESQPAPDEIKKKLSPRNKNTSGRILLEGFPSWDGSQWGEIIN